MTDTIQPIVPQDVPDFGIGGVAAPPIPFRVDGEMFYAMGMQPAGLIFDLAGMTKDSTFEAQVQTFTTLIQGMLVPESFERLKIKMRDPISPLTFPKMMELIQWLMEQYGKRPTTPSSYSQQPSTVTNITSTVGAPPAV